MLSGFLLCRLTTSRSLLDDRRQPDDQCPSTIPGSRYSEGFMVLDLQEMEHMLNRARASREEIKASHAEMQQLIVEDPLTGCRNRRAMGHQAQDLWTKHTESGEALSCLMFDVDHFKKFNDDHGHATGDEVLRRVGQALRSTFAGVGQVYRYGGEEFCVLLPGHDLAESRWIAERVRKTIEEIQIESSTSEEMLHVTASVGATDLKQLATSCDEMIAQADHCLYMAKRKGRNIVIAYDKEVANAHFRP